MISNFHNYTTTGFFLFLLFSCERIENKGNEVSHHLIGKLNNKAEIVMDKISPKFDAYHPDTEFNKKRFKDFLKVALSPDIKNIYCFDDAIGIDADYQFSFNCNKSTAELIRKRNEGSFMIQSQATFILTIPLPLSFSPNELENLSVGHQ